MGYLITYQQGGKIHETCIRVNHSEWRIIMLANSDGPYIILNVLPVTREQWDMLKEEIGTS